MSTPSNITPGDTVFIRFGGRVYRGVVIRFFMSEGHVQVETPCAALIHKPWKLMCFHLDGGTACANRNAVLIVPVDEAERQALEHEAASAQFQGMCRDIAGEAVRRGLPVAPAPRGRLVPQFPDYLSPIKAR